MQWFSAWDYPGPSRPDPSRPDLSRPHGEVGATRGERTILSALRVLPGDAVIALPALHRVVGGSSLVRASATLTDSRPAVPAPVV